MPGGERWLHEIKFDGYRVQLHIANEDVKVFTGRGHDWTKRFRKIAADAFLINARSAIIDGEIVVPAADGTTDFSVLHDDHSRTGSSTAVVGRDRIGDRLVLGLVAAKAAGGRTLRTWTPMDPRGLASRSRLVLRARMNQGNRISMFENTPKAERIELAKARIQRVLDHLLYVIELHANNEFVVYSNTLSSQIPRSYAANAFLVFQRSMYQIEVVRLCALWDRAELARENIPTVIELIDDSEIIEKVGDENLRYWEGGDMRIMNPSADPKMAELERQATVAADQKFGEQQAAKAKAELRHAIAISRDIKSSAMLASVMNTRDKHLAHSLIFTRREMDGPVAPMKIGQETALLKASVSIVEKLYRVITGKGFMIDDAQEIDHRNAEALWKGCKFDVLR